LCQKTKTIVVFAEIKAVMAEQRADHRDKGLQKGTLLSGWRDPAFFMPKKHRNA